MIRRLLVVGVLACAAMALSKARAQRAAVKREDRDAKASWDSEGGSPTPDPVDTPVPA